MEGIKNMLQWVYSNWSSVVICFGLGVAIYNRVKNWIKLSDEQKISLAKDKIKETILKYISDAEFEYQEFVEAGSVKRAEVIAKIYLDYPILDKAIVQDELLVWIDTVINDALPALRDLIKKNTHNEISEQGR